LLTNYYISVAAHKTMSREIVVKSIVKFISDGVNNKIKICRYITTLFGIYMLFY
jgi:hypothetical protein